MEIDGINLAIGGGAVSAIAGVVGAWIRAKYHHTHLDNDPVNVQKLDKYVTRGEFNKHVEDNTRDMENIFARLNAGDKMTSKLDGILMTILTDVQDIKHKLFK